MAGAHGVLRRLSVLLMVETVSGAWGPSTGTHTSPPFPGSAVNQTPVADCHLVSGLNASERCDFVRTNPDCRSPGGYLDYLDGLFCHFPPGLLPLAVTLYASWLLYLFLILGVTASKFFCPNLWAISATLKLSHNVAGVTFLAFGNGAPDIFSALVAFSDPRTAGLAIGALFGAGVLVTTVVAGGIAVLHPFLAASRPFLRDIAFYMVAVFLTFTALYLGRVTLAWALGYLGLYLFYVVTVVLCTWIYRWQRRKSLVCSLPGTPELLSDSEEDPVSSGTNSCDFGDEFRPLLDQEESTARALARALNPLDCRTWRSKPASWRALKLFKLPVEFLLLLTVPVVDPDKDDRNWKRPLNCLQLAVSPLVLTLTLQSGASPLCSYAPWTCGRRARLQAGPEGLEARVPLGPALPPCGEGRAVCRILACSSRGKGAPFSALTRGLRNVRRLMGGQRWRLPDRRPRAGLGRGGDRRHSHGFRHLLRHHQRAAPQAPLAGVPASSPSILRTCQSVSVHRCRAHGSLPLPACRESEAVSLGWELPCGRSLAFPPALCFPGLPDQRPVDQRGCHGGGEHPEVPGCGLPAEQHGPGAHAAGLGEQHRRRLRRLHAGPPGLPADGLLGLFRGHHLQHAGGRGAGLPAADRPEPRPGGGAGAGRTAGVGAGQRPGPQPGPLPGLGPPAVFPARQSLRLGPAALLPELPGGGLAH
ncbi:mitochondrial sodium/calcium exchanger protein isoform X2 [Sciurus carolinensis]|uniref:mitochondrial sodium/calcium exchanger protein isoform X2 n=1 Tax=Sciurus carolinensis TaxID=30640 RepID=UPI001FB2F76D|nr:mitochondrial sodium/calcium exchanger protein isoform X2 [Sciurus carolinensis]